jgi:NADPH2:quinone reductase
MIRVHAIQVHDVGGPEALRFEEVEVAGPDALAPDQALVRNHAIGVNFIDTYHRSGLYPLEDLPRVIGQEGAGVVEAIGADVDAVAVGDRVAYATAGPGSYAEARVIPAEKLVPIPEAVTFEQAAAVLLQGMTVEYLVQRTFAVQPGMTVLFHAAAGGVGLLACRWLSDLGATVIGTVSTEAKADLARAHGCTHPVIYTREDFVDRVQELTDGRGVPVVYDSVGKDTFARGLDCLAPRGMLVGFGNASGRPDPIDPLLLARKGSLFLTRPALFHYVATREELLASADAVFARVARGVLKAEPRHRYALSDARRCHEDLEARRTSGSIVMLP